MPEQRKQLTSTSVNLSQQPLNLAEIIQEILMESPELEDPLRSFTAELAEVMRDPIASEPDPPFKPCLGVAMMVSNTWICACGFIDDKSASLIPGAYSIDYHPDLSSS